MGTILDSLSAVTEPKVDFGPLNQELQFQNVISECRTDLQLGKVQ